MKEREGGLGVVVVVVVVVVTYCLAPYPSITKPKKGASIIK